MPGVSTWFERFLDADKVLIYLINRDPKDQQAEDVFWRGMRALERDREPELGYIISELPG